MRQLLAVAGIAALSVGLIGVISSATATPGDPASVNRQLGVVEKRIELVERKVNRVLVGLSRIKTSLAPIPSIQSETKAIESCVRHLNYSGSGTC